jgi:hypothetical protein
MGWLVPRRNRLRDEPRDDSPPQLPCIHAVLRAREVGYAMRNCVCGWS